jgi:hypothetical protein
LNSKCILRFGKRAPARFGKRFQPQQLDYEEIEDEDEEEMIRELLEAAEHERLDIS